MSQTTTRRRYPKACKIDVITHSDQQENIAAFAQDLGIRPELIYRWRSEYAKDPDTSFPGNGIPQQSAEEAELTRLQREKATLRMERDIRTKALGLCSTSDG